MSEQLTERHDSSSSSSSEYLYPTTEIGLLPSNIIFPLHLYFHHPHPHHFLLLLLLLLLFLLSSHILRMIQNELSTLTFTLRIKERNDWLAEQIFTLSVSHTQDFIQSLWIIISISWIFHSIILWIKRWGSRCGKIMHLQIEKKFFTSSRWWSLILASVLRPKHNSHRITPIYILIPSDHDEYW